MFSLNRQKLPLAISGHKKKRRLKVRLIRSRKVCNLTTVHQNQGDSATILNKESRDSLDLLKNQFIAKLGNPELGHSYQRKGEDFRLIFDVKIIA